MAAKPIPEGYHTLTPYLVVEDTAKAIDFYKEAFGAEEIMRMQAPDGSIGHAEIQIGDSRVMMSDPFPQSSVRPPSERGGPTASLFAYVEDVDLSLRARLHGFEIVFVPGAVVRHKGSASTGGSASTHNLYYDTRNTVFVTERNRPLPRVLRPLRRGVIVGAHLLQAATHPTRSAAVGAVLEGWRDARAGRTGQRRSR